MKDLKLMEAGVIIIATFVFFYMLSIGQAIVVPLVISLFLIILFTSAYNFFNSKFNNKFLSILTTLAIFGSFFVVIYFIVSSQANAFADELPRYREALTEMFNRVNNLLGGAINLSPTEVLKDGNITESISSIFSKITGGITSFIGILGTTIIFLIFILLETKYFKIKFEKILDEKGERKFFGIVKEINDDISYYFLMKFMVATLSGISGFIILSLFGLEYALMFALLIFLFDFIPNIGGLFAMALPFIYSFLVFDSTGLSFALLAVLIAQQTVIGNFIEPKIMGSRLNLSPLIILISLIFWGSLWGIAGAIMALPIMASLSIVFSKFKRTRFLHILMTEKGKDVKAKTGFGAKFKNWKDSLFSK